MGVIVKFLVVVVVLSGCTKTVKQCTVDSDCTNPLYPFCDVDGTYAAAEGNTNVCTIVPPNCPVERCGCQPGAVTCVDTTLTTCASDGKSVTTDTCSLGCDTTDNRCFTFVPTNGMAGPLTASAPEAAVTLPDSVTIDTTACEIRDSSNNQLVAVKSLTVTQLNAPSICAFYASSFDVTNADVTGSNVLGFAAAGAITIHGKIDGSARPRFQALLNAGPGAVTTGDCMGVAPGNGTTSGAGGAGNGTAGANGVTQASVPIPVAGGLAEQNFTPVFGGCAGTVINAGGGGAMQLVSLTAVNVLQSALLAFGAQGGEGGGGGGAGGTIIFEAPLVSILGGVAANGGGGSANGNCTNGAEVGFAATNDALPAPGGSCNTNLTVGGAGGTGTSAPTKGVAGGSGTGGGGAVGRILIRTADGTFTGPGTLFSIAKTTDTLVKH